MAQVGTRDSQDTAGALCGPASPLALGCCPGGAMAEAAGTLDGGLRLDDFADHIVHQPDGSDALTLIVQNLHCPSCIRTIEGAVEDLPGLAKARVNLGTRRLRLQLNHEVTTAEPVLSAVAARGYRIVPLDPEQMESAEAGESR